MQMAEWLVKLDNYATNLQKQFMKFRWRDQKYKVYGFDPPPTGSIITPNTETDMERSSNIYGIMLPY